MWRTRFGSVGVDGRPCLYPRVIRLGVQDRFVEHGSTAELNHMLALDAEGIAKTISENCHS